MTGWMGDISKTEARDAILEREAVQAARREAGQSPRLGLGPSGEAVFRAFLASPPLMPLSLHAGTAAGYLSGENPGIVQKLKEETEARAKARAAEAAKVPGPQAMNAGGIPAMGLRTLLAQSAMGAIGDKPDAGPSWTVPNMKIGTPGQYAPKPRALPRLGTSAAERFVTGNIHLPTEPAEMARVKGLGLPKPVAEAERMRIATLGVRKPALPAIGAWAGTKFEGFGAERAAAALPDAGAWAGEKFPGFGSLPAKPAAEGAYLSDEEWSAMAGPPVKPKSRFDDPNIFKAVPELAALSNTDRLQPVKPRGPDWVSAESGMGSMMRPAATAGPPGATGDLAGVQATLIKMLAVLEKIAAPTRATGTPAPLPVGAPVSGAIRH